MNTVARYLNVLAIAVTLATTAQGTIIINTDQSGSGSLGTVALDRGDTGTTVFGTTDEGALLQFMATETLMVPAGGQARIKAQDGGFTSLDIRFLGGNLFDRIVFNLNAATSGSVSINAYDQSNQLFSQVLSLSPRGSNFINVESDHLQQIASLNFTTSTPVQITDMAQVRVGGVEQAAVPEPGSMGLFGMGALAVGLGRLRIGRRRAFRRTLPLYSSGTTAGMEIGNNNAALLLTIAPGVSSK